jgi:hypothetical protein
VPNMAALGLRPATLAALHDAEIRTLYRLLNHSVRELVWHRALSAEQVHEDDRVAVECDQIDLPAARAGVADEDRVAEAFEVNGG